MKNLETGQTGQAKIDHIVFGCDQLGNGTSYLEGIFGARFSSGGKHHLMATHNTLLKLQNSIYLEAIAIDHDASITNGDLGRCRWFSLDEDLTKQKLKISPQPLCWVVAVDDIHEMTSKCGYDAGQITRVTRDDLEWKLTIPADGSLSESGLLPSFIQWPNGQNPAHLLPESGILLKKVVLVHPRPSFITSIMDRIHIDGPIEVRQGPTELIFELETHAGELVLFSNASA